MIEGNIFDPCKPTLKRQPVEEEEGGGGEEEESSLCFLFVCSSLSNFLSIPLSMSLSLSLYMYVDVKVDIFHRKRSIA